MDLISGVIFTGIAFVLAVLFFFGIAVWLEIQPQKKQAPRPAGRALSTSRRFNNVHLTEM